MQEFFTQDVLGVTQALLEIPAVEQEELRYTLNTET
jgi:hypothetical protein